MKAPPFSITEDWKRVPFGHHDRERPSLIDIDLGEHVLRVPVLKDP